MSTSSSVSGVSGLHRPVATRSRFVQGFFLVVFVGAAILFVRLFLPYATAIILAVILASVFYPVYESFERLFHGRRSLAAALMCLLVVLVVVLPLAGFITLIAKEIADFLSQLPSSLSVADLRAILQGGGLFAEALAWISERFRISLDPLQVRAALIDAGKEAANLVAVSSGAIAKSVAGAVIQFLLMLFTLYYLFRDGKNLMAYLMDLSPLPETQERQIMRRFREVGAAVFYGNIALAVLQGLIAGVGFLLFGVPGAFLGGALIGLLALIPFLGGALVYVPAALTMWWHGYPLAAIGLILFCFSSAFFLDNVLRPKLLEKRLQMHPLLVFFSIIGGLAAFGGLGILYGPLIMTVFLALIEIYKRDFRDPHLASVPARTEGGPTDSVLG